MAPDGAPAAAPAQTAVEVWRQRVVASGDQAAYRHRPDRAELGTWQSMTWRQADSAAREIAAGLAALGVGRGDPVCVLGQTRLEWVLCDLGILLAGGATVPIYASSTPDQVGFIVRDSGAKVLIVENAAQLDKVLLLQAQM